ncbi:MAG: ABC transporter substrate-binding protein [Candidatus Carbobacillus altaicus]|nr:ABC transporter substrate-binding protein [Candidatus Carbobacillus altaicus]
MTHNSISSRVLYLFMVFALIFFLGACGSTHNSKKNSTSQELDGTNTQDQGNVTLPDTNRLVVYSAGPKELAENLIEHFKDQTGLDVELFQSTTGKILSRLEAEKNNPQADIVILASLPAGIDLTRQGRTYPYKPIHFEYVHDGWADPDGNYVATSGSALGVTYNTQSVHTLPQDWKDFTQKEWKDQVLMPDPTLSGSAMDFLVGYIYKFGDEGWKLFEELKTNGLKVEGANTESLDAVKAGQKKAVLAGVDYMAYAAKAKGEPIDMIYPKSGTVINQRPAMIMKDSKNLKNAMAFMDFLLSDEAQKLVSEAYLIPGRKDIHAEGRTNLDEIVQLPFDYDWMSTHQEEVISRFDQLFH